MENPADGTPPLVAAPRHLRLRRLHPEIPDVLLVPGVEPFPLEPRGSKAATETTAVEDAESQQAFRASRHHRKRLVALLAILVVAISLAALGLALLLG